MIHKPIISPVFDQTGAKFVLMPIGEKFPPIEKEWQNKGHTFQEAAAHNGNVGIMAGNGFIGLDKDDLNGFADNILKNLPEPESSEIGF